MKDHYLKSASNPKGITSDCSPNVALSPWLVLMSSTQSAHQITGPTEQQKGVAISPNERVEWRRHSPGQRITTCWARTETDINFALNAIAMSWKNRIWNWISHILKTFGRTSKQIYFWFCVKQYEESQREPNSGEESRRSDRSADRLMHAMPLKSWRSLRCQRSLATNMSVVNRFLFSALNSVSFLLCFCL